MSIYFLIYCLFIQFSRIWKKTIFLSGKRQNLKMFRKNSLVNKINLKVISNFLLPKSRRNLSNKSKILYSTYFFSWLLVFHIIKFYLSIFLELDFRVKMKLLIVEIDFIWRRDFLALEKIPVQFFEKVMFFNLGEIFTADSFVDVSL